MENATRALSMAGAILITIIIIALGVQAYNRIKEMPMSEEERLEVEELSRFNSKFEIYNKTSLYKAEFRSAINKIVDNNRVYPEYRIEISIDGEIKLDEEAKVYVADTNIPDFWRCTKIEYDGGRISKIYFEHVAVSAEPS